MFVVEDFASVGKYLNGTRKLIGHDDNGVAM